ncbi:MAG: GGDEF domain-containing protein [Hyphomicrobium sp.]
MHFEQVRQSLLTAKSVLNQIALNAYPADPTTYQVLYHHTTGEPPSFAYAVNSILKSKPKLDEADIEKLSDEFCSKGDFVERSGAVGALLSDEIRRLGSAFEFAKIEASNRSEALSEATSLYEGREQLRELVQLLILTAKNMEQSNKQLEAQLSSSIIEIKRLKERLEVARADSLVDPLTLLQNRASFDNTLAQVMRHAAETKSPVSLLMIDIDHFKTINDRFGHLIGDQIIKMVAAAATRTTGEGSHLARFGGEEFLALLGVGMKDAVAVAERIRRQVNQGEYRLKKTGEMIGQVSVSIGVSVLRSTDTALSFIERADQCLYAAKSRGRDRVLSETEL